MKAERLKDCVKAAEITLSREEWHGLYLVAGNVLP
jgi:predicted oxidoreductase